MAGICFFFEDNDIDMYSGRVIDLEAWNYATQAGGEDMKDMLVLNCTGVFGDYQDIRTPNKRFNFESRKHSGRDPHPELKGRVAYFMIPTDKRVQKSLWDFDHEVDWYCFGPAHSDHFQPEKEDVCITIPLPVQLHAVHTANIVMAHRYHVRNS